MRTPGRLGLRAALLSATLVTCTSDHPTGPSRFGRGYLAIRPVLSSPVELAAFGLTIDRLRVVAVRPVADTALDTTVAFSPDSASLHVSLSVLLHAAVETFVLHLELRAGPVVLFSGTNTVQVSSGPPDTSSAATIPLSYVGPGSGLTGLRIGPRDSVVTLRDSLQFGVAADSLGIPVSSFYVHWSTSDTVNAPINGAGLLRAPNARLSVFVRAVTPNAVRDSTRVTFVPVPAAVAAVVGSGQTGTVGTRLPVPLRALVKGSDSVGVQGIPVRFQAVSGGSVRDSVVVTDSLGFAEDTATLDTIAGARSFRATVGALTATFTATATPGAISAARSLVTVSAGTVASGSGVTLTLRGKDQFGNNLTTGGATVVFDTTGGTSTGNIGPVADHGDGTYTATFTGLVVGTATTIGATINGTAVTTTLPTISVTAGAISPLTSVVSTSSGTVSSGATATLTLLAKDSVGNVLGTGGATVVFSRTGGTGTGAIGATTDQANGTYTATFTADSAGTPTTIRATIGGVLATSTTTITVVPGNTTAARSVITVSPDTIAAGGTSTLKLQAKDGAGNNITTGGLTVVFSDSGGTSTGTIAPSPATDNGNGTYTATFTGQTAGTATTIHATINGQQVTSTLPTITVRVSPISAATSVVTSSDSVLSLSGVATLTLLAKDASGNAITTGGATVVFTQSGGTSAGTISATTDHADGSYTATFTGQTAGSPTTIGATINGGAVTSGPLPVIRVFSSVHTADITADSTWTAAASPHIVSNYIRVRNGATLTIQPGATVKFDPGAGLQVGDTASSQAGRLNIDGAALGIILTANTGTPVPGFWRGIEVQRALSGSAWRKTTIEYGGGTRAPFGGTLSEACVLVVNRSGAALDLDSLRIRQCVHAGIHHFGGTAHVHRGTIDSVTGSGIHVDYDAQLELDSTTIRGSGQEGLFFGSTTSRLLPSSANQFRSNAVTGIHVMAFQLPGLLKQDSIVGNGSNLIEVGGGQPDPTVAAFTIFAQPQGAGSNGYLIQGGLLDVGLVGGQMVTLDSNLVLRFGAQSGLVIGDSAGTRSGSLVSLGTNRTNAPHLTSAKVGPAPGDWYGLEIGRLANDSRLANVRIEFAGDSIYPRSRHRFGLLVRSPAAHTLSVDSVVVVQSGRIGADTNAAAFGILGAGAGVDVRRSVANANIGYGFVSIGAKVKLVNDTARTNTIGFAIFTDSGGSGASSTADSVAGNVASGNTTYPLQLDIRHLPGLYGNAFIGNAHDTLLVDGGTVTFTDTLPHFAGLPWRIRNPIQINSGAVLTIAAGDTVAFDSGAGIVVGEGSPAALDADGSSGRILLTASGPVPQGWHGIDFHLMSGSGSTTNNVFRHVDVDRAGFIAPCFGECSPIHYGALRFTDSIAPTTVDLSITDIIVRRSNAIALDFQRGGAGTVSVAGSQFYANKPDPMIRTRFGSGSQLSITGSDLYHYRGQVIQSAYQGGAADSVDAVNNWWGDVRGADTSFLFQDSLGRASTNRYAARVFPFAAAPFFPGGPAAAIVTTVDSLLPGFSLGSSDSIRVRVVDANGRGVGSQPVTWATQPPAASSVSPSGGTSDIGGRFDALWLFTNTAGNQIATASGAGAASYFVTVLPGLSTAVGWALDATRSQGTVTAPRAITFTSTNRNGVIVTHAHDSFNNATQPTYYCFTTINAPGCQSFYPQLGFVDSIHTSGGVSGDTIFFHANVNQAAPFVLRSSYYVSTGGQVDDSVVITMNSAPAGVKIDRDQYSIGVQAVPDTSGFNALCPSGPPNFYCQRTLQVFVVDSGLTLVASATPTFQWNLVTGSAVTLDSVRGANDLAFVTARSNGIARLAVKDISANNYGTDTLPLLVNQKATYIYVTPDTVSVPVGGSTTFRAAVTDIGGDTMPAMPVHWRPDNAFNPHLTITDTTTAHQAIVRLNGTPFGSEYVTAFAVNGPADTAYGYAQVINPLLRSINVGIQPWAIAANSQTHAVYVGHQAGPLYKIDGVAGTAVDSVVAGLTVSAVAVNPVTNLVYAATEQGVAVFDGATLALQATVAAGINDQGVQNRQGLTVDSINNRIYVTVIKTGGPLPVPVLRRIDGTTFLPTNDVTLPDTGNGAVFNPNDGFVYVTIPDSNLVVAVNPATKTIVKRIAVGSQPFAIALNPNTNRLYVIDQIFTSNYPYNLYVIDPVGGAVTATIPMGFQTASLAVDAVNHRVYVGAKYNGYVSVIDGATTFLVGTVNATGFYSDQELGVAFDAANGHVYTANYSSASITRLKY